jgi:hypothetical protein
MQAQGIQETNLYIKMDFREITLKYLKWGKSLWIQSKESCSGGGDEIKKNKLGFIMAFHDTLNNLLLKVDLKM